MRWPYIALHSDSLSANLLFETQLARNDFKQPIVDRVICYGHQLNLGALEGADLLKHTTPIHRFMALLANDKTFGELLDACAKVAGDTDVQRMVRPPQVAKDYVNFLLEHTFPEIAATVTRHHGCATRLPVEDGGGLQATTGCYC